MKAVLKVLVYLGLSFIGLFAASIIAFWAWAAWLYHLPSDQLARQQFVGHKADYVRLASLLRQDPNTIFIDSNGEVESRGSHWKFVPEYFAPIRNIGAKSIYLRQDGSIEFELWGFGCAPCADSFKGVRFAPADGQPKYPYGGAPLIVRSLENSSLPKSKGAVADGLYVVPIDREWSIYRLEISD